MIKRYSELRRFESFEERYEYLMLGGAVGQTTFGFDRHLNQGLYKSYEWRQVRREVIIRDNGCDLGIEGYEIHGELLVHHMNPIGPDDIVHHNEDRLFNPQYLITTTQHTHNAIHYGDKSLLRVPAVPRSAGDTRLW